MNIWHIRNKYLRAAATWVLVVLGVAIALAALPFIIVGAGVAGVYGALVLQWDEWRELAGNAWRAMTGREVA